MRRAISVLSALLVLGTAACDRRPARVIAPAQVSARSAGRLPSWILSLAPKEKASSNAQIRVIFQDDLIPLESLEAPDHQEILSHLRMEPQLPGRFALLTPRMIAFVADAPLPPATRVRVTLTAGLADLRGHTLNHDFAWTFQSDALALTTNLPDEQHAQSIEPSGLKPDIVVFSNAELDEASLLARARLVDTSDSGGIVQLARKAQAPASPTPPSEASGENQTLGYTYTLTPERALDRARRYRFEIAPGVLPAHGNLPTTRFTIGLLDTFAPLTLQGVSAYGKPEKDGTPGRFAEGAPQLLFTNGLVAQSAEKAIAIQPPPRNAAPLTRIDDGDTTIALNPYALVPDTLYTITVAADLKDVFGQTLGAPAKQTFLTSKLAGDLWAPSGFSIFPSGENLALNVVATNLLEGEYRTGFHAVKPEELLFADPTEEAGVEKLLPPASAWVTVGAARGDNTSETQSIPLRKRLGSATGLLAYGVTAKTNATLADDGAVGTAQPRFIGAVQLTNIGLFAQWFPDAGIVRAQRLSDGMPIAGASVTVYPSYTDSQKHGSVEPCASGRTNAQGELELRGPAFVRCAVVSEHADRPSHLLVIARNGGDWAFVRTDDWSGAYGYGAGMGWSAGSPQAHGAIVSDRDLYQPGETAYLTGIAYFDENGVLTKGRASSYRLTLEGPGGAKRDMGTASLDAFGAFSRAIVLDKDQELGYYTLRARADNGEELYGTFRTAEFKPPNFKVSLSLDRAYAMSGQSVAASWASAYLFGAPVEGGKSSVNVTRSRTWFTPMGWDAFSFGRMWLYPEEEPTVPSDVLQEDAAVPADGKNARTIPVAGDLPYPMAYQVDAQTADVSNLSVDDTKTFTALPSDRLIGLKGDFIGTAGRAHEIAVIVVDPDGKPRADRRVHVVLQERSYGSATQVTEGSQTPVDSVHYGDVASADVTPGTRAASVSLTPPKAGSYRIRANFADAKSDATATDAELWVSGADADWGRDDGNELAVKLDKATYRPGDTARVLVQSPYPEAELFLAVVRHGVFFKKTVLVKGSAPQLTFTVTPDMLPNAAVEAVLVRRGPTLDHGVPQGLRNVARIGFAPFDVALDGKYLKTVLIPEHDRVEPQGEQSVRVHVTDASGRGARAEVALAVVNDAVLQLNGYRFPDLTKIVYAEQPISTRFADNREAVTLASPTQPVEKGFGYGGGFEAGAAGTRVRTQFKPIAFYDGAIKTDASGNATARFKLPDDLTTWRVMAMAFTQDARFGNGEAAFIATKPLVTNAVLPRFARPGDTFLAGVAVTNTNKLAGNIGISGVLGGDLAFVDKDDRTLSSTTIFSAPMDQLTQAFRFPMRATGKKTGNVQFTTLLGNERDAFVEPLEIRANEVTENTVEAGVTNEKAVIPLAPAPHAAQDIGGLDVTLASTLLPDAGEVVRAMSADETPLATAIASRVSVAADALLLDRRYKRTADLPALRTMLAENLGALRALRREDGGYAPWPGASGSDISSTAFCAVSLSRARAAGVNVSMDIARVRAFLLSRLNDPSQETGGKREPQRSEIRLEALETLAILGDVRNDHLADVYAQRKKFAFYEQVELARLLLKLPSWRAQSAALRDELFEQTHLTGGAASVNIPDASLETATAGQARMVGLLIDSHTPGEDVDRAFRALLDLRTNGVWACPCDNARAMDAMVAYAALQTAPPDFTATVQIPGATVRARFHGDENALIERHIPMAKLPRGNSSVTVSKTGTGTLHYVVAYRYGLLGEQPGVYAGIRLERILRSAGDEKELARFGSALPAAPLSLEAGRVFEIEDRIITDHPINQVVVNDPLPAGFEAVDTAFRTSTRAFEPGIDNWEIDYRRIYRDRVIAFARHLEAGVYAVHYLVRSVTPGTFTWPGASVHPEYAPEDFGRTAAGHLVVR